MHISKIVIHHSLTKDGQIVDWQAIRDYHVNHLHWRDVGYHYGIELLNGRYEIIKGRLDTEMGAHALGFNDMSIGICLIGNYDAITPSEAALYQLRRLCRSLMAIHRLTPADVIGHWETYARRGVIPQKTCPGKLFDMDAFRKSL